MNPQLLYRLCRRLQARGPSCRRPSPSPRGSRADPATRTQFSLTDTSIQHTFATKQRISFGECIVYAGVIPAVIILLVALIWRRSFWDW